MPTTCVIGGQWGDEGKGKLVDYLSSQDFNIVARFNGGANAGHSVVVEGKKFALNLLPCGIIQDGVMNLIGNGVVLEIPKLLDELSALEKAGVDWKGRLLISDRCHLLFGFHKVIDGIQEGTLLKDSIGTTKRGIGPCYSSKVTRNGLRACDLRNPEVFKRKYMTLFNALKSQYPFEYDAEKELKEYDEFIKILSPMLVDGVFWINQSLKNGKKILLEGANATMLDLDLGTYPFVTSSTPNASGACTGLGIAPSKIGTIYAVAKAYCTRVGNGPFPTELEGEDDEKLRTAGHEFGTTTGRPRRCGWLDLVQLNYTHTVNNLSGLCITKLDCLSYLDEVKICVGYDLDGKRLEYMPADLETLGNVTPIYETFPGWKGKDITKARKLSELPESCQKYLHRIEEILKVPIKFVGVGSGRDEIIVC